MMRKSICALCMGLIPLMGFSQLNNYDKIETPHYRQTSRALIQLPTIPGYETLKCELHSHTIYSDGHVLPRNRVEEAWVNGLDAIAITDHLGSRKFEGANDNTSYEEAKETAEQTGILLIRSTELTYSEPTGHLNAFFIKDADLIYKTQKEGKEHHPMNAEAGVREAIRQGAFVAINHPGWPDDESTLTDQQVAWIKEGLVKGVEISNDGDYYPKTIDDCGRYNLAMIAASDVHSTISMFFSPDILRPMTLVFSKDRSLEGIKEGLEARRTISLFDNKVAGRKELVEPFVLGSLICKKLYTDKNGKVTYELSNPTDVPYLLTSVDNEDRYLMVNKRSAARVTLPKEGSYKYYVKNAILSSKECLVISLPLK